MPCFLNCPFPVHRATITRGDTPAFPRPTSGQPILHDRFGAGGLATLGGGRLHCLPDGDHAADDVILGELAVNASAPSALDDDARGCPLRRALFIDSLFAGETEIIQEATHRVPAAVATTQRFSARTSTPVATRRIPAQSRVDGRSCRNRTANRATSTTLSLSIGATLDASPALRARK